MENLAEKIYNTLLDMDGLDYAETYMEDIKNLVNDLKLLEVNGTGALLEAIKIMMYSV